ncbi:MAG: hypothetical protein FD146_1691 [Anaerolineaceae bacterium]|nr:MAG: hypothetical protein FD146_1691 [Anaerolineaceae bacterium]
MNNIQPDFFRQIQEAIRLPEGSFVFKYHSPDLLDKNKKGGVIFEIPSGQHIFKLERDDNFKLNFYHSSPGTGTRVASIDLAQVHPAEHVQIFLTWGPNEINLYLGPMVEGGQLVAATGSPASFQLRVGRDGNIYQVGDDGVQVMGISIFQGNQPVLQPTAVDVWKSTLQAIDILGTGESKEGFIYEVVVTNLSIVILVTGFEAYTKTRFLELEGEGIQPNVEAIINAFYSQRERSAGAIAILDEEAKTLNVTTVDLIVSKRVIDFQNYEKCKLAYNKAYGIKFGEMGFANQALEQLQEFLKYRHRIIHISPLQAMLNQAQVPLEEPVFSKKETLQAARKCFDEFINKLHSTTLQLRPKR